MSDSRVDNPMLPDEESYRPEHDTGAHDRPDQLKRHLEKVEAQDVTAPGKQAAPERPYALPGEDEGPLGEGGQLREPDAGSGST
ncbi:MAG: hypothetical protein ACRD12_13430 [Acidimicrobiales bacterium]